MCEARIQLGRQHRSKAGRTEADRARDLQGKLEPVGRFVRSPRNAYVAERLHGKVVNFLIRALGQRKVQSRKVRSVDGCELDLLIERGPPIVIEVKSGATSRDMQTGIGQLGLYPPLMGLPECQRVLLVPADTIPDALQSAVSACGVALCRHSWPGEIAGEGEPGFEATFMALSGMV